MLFARTHPAHPADAHVPAAHVARGAVRNGAAPGNDDGVLRVGAVELARLGRVEVRQPGVVGAVVRPVVERGALHRPEAGRALGAGL